MARCNLFGASVFPYPEEQHPHAARGEKLADFARSLDIRRGMTYSSGRFSKLIVDVYSPRTRTAGSTNLLYEMRASFNKPGLNTCE